MPTSANSNWNVPKIWDGGEVWILGGGSSLTQQFEIPNSIVDQVRRKELGVDAYSPYMAGIHNKHVIAVNSAFLIGDWIDMVFFGDKSWFLKNRERLASFPGIKVSSSPATVQDRFKRDGIKFLKKYQNGWGISPKSNMICWNKNSGAAAISVAANAGAKKIVLVGFDMKLDKDKNQHWHNLYRPITTPPREAKKLPFHRHLVGFEQISRDAKKRGIDIINASPDSEIKQFRKTTVKELLI